jgi:hypothetical protein
MNNTKEMIGQTVLYKDYDNQIIQGIINYIGFQNKTKTITWYSVDFGYKQFLVPEKELIFKNIQLTLF